MNEIIKNEQGESTMGGLGETFAQIIRDAVKQELNSSRNGQLMGDADRLLTVEQVAERLNVSVDWVYDNAKKFPFTRKLGPKMLRFSERGLQKYLETTRGRC